MYNGLARRVPVPQQAQQQAYPKTLPAATRGIIQNENPAFMKPAAAIFLQNWFPTQNTLKARGGSAQWCSTSTLPIQSMFNYAIGDIYRLFAANKNSIYDCTYTGTASAVVTGQNDGNYSVAQFSNQAGDYLFCCNDNGDLVQRFDGTHWLQLSGTTIYAPPGYGVVSNGMGLTAVWKYRNRLFFIEGGTFNAWYLDINAIQGQLSLIPLSGSCRKGGSLLFGTTWSTASGSGLGDQCVFVTTEGEFIIFQGTDPSNVNNWAQEGVYEMSLPLGKNAFLRVAGDVMFCTNDGIIPLTQAILKDPAAMQLATVTVAITPLWKQQAAQKNNLPWSMVKWDSFGGLFVTWPGAPPGQSICAVANVVTGAWTTYTGWDAQCFCLHLNNLFFGDQKGNVIQAEIGGNDLGSPYVCSYVGGWEVFGMPPNVTYWRQARATFQSSTNSPIEPQITAAIDYNFTLPIPPAAAPDPGGTPTWDNGLWDVATWDASVPVMSPTYTTWWISIGQLGRSHAPIVQITLAQQSKPDIQMLGVSGIVERVGLAV